MNRAKAPAPTAARRPARRGGGTQAGTAAAGGDALTSPMQGTIVKVAVEEGQQVEAVVQNGGPRPQPRPA